MTLWILFSFHWYVAIICFPNLLHPTAAEKSAGGGISPSLSKNSTAAAAGSSCQRSAPSPPLAPPILSSSQKSDASMESVEFSGIGVELSTASTSVLPVRNAQVQIPQPSTPKPSNGQSQVSRSQIPQPSTPQPPNGQPLIPRPSTSKPPNGQSPIPRPPSAAQSETKSEREISGIFGNGGSETSSLMSRFEKASPCIIIFDSLYPGSTAAYSSNSSFLRG